jgi:hypothetical protein
MKDTGHHTANRSVRPKTNFKDFFKEYFDEENSKLKFNQVNKFVDDFIGYGSISSCKHVLLVYEEIERARQIELRYIRNQLQRNETCACLVRSDTIEADKSMLMTDMRDNGINVDALQRTHQLRIIAVTDPDILDHNPKTASALVEAYSEILQRDGKPPSAGFGIIASEQDLVRHERMALQIELEQIANQLIGQSEVTWICPYRVDDVFESLEKEWMQELLINHDAVIYAPKNSNGLALRLV